MSPLHYVKEREHLSGIAAQYGFATQGPIWNAPENAALREKRADPNLLAPGDEVFIPDIKPATFRRPTALSHRFEVARPRLQVRARFMDAAGHPFASRVLVVQDSRGQRSLTTDDDGVLSFDVSLQERSVDVLAPTEAEEGAARSSGDDTLLATLEVGLLDPSSQDLGPRERLVNLGYIADDGEFGGDVELELAVQEFQVDHGLPVTGALDGPTIAAIVSAHGS